MAVQLNATCFERSSNHEKEQRMLNLWNAIIPLAYNTAQNKATDDETVSLSDWADKNISEIERSDSNDKSDDNQNITTKVAQQILKKGIGNRLQ